MKSIYKAFVWIAFILLPAFGFGQFNVIDKLPGGSGINPQNLVAFGSSLYFSADDGVNGRELWISDGNTSNTTNTKMVYDVNPAGSSNPAELTAYNGYLYFTASNQLYKYDPVTPPGGVIPNLYQVGELAVIGGALYFSASNIAETELWKIVGNAAPVMIDVNSGAGNSNPAEMTEVNGIVYFSADGANGRELYKYDPIGNTSSEVADIYPGVGNSSFPTQLIAANGILYFTANDGTTGIELWQHDPAANGGLGATTQVADIHPTGSSNPTFLTNVAGTLFFSAFADAFPRLYKAAAGTATVISGTFGPTNLINVNGTLYFNGLGGGGYELWKSDVAGNASQVRDINTAGDSQPANMAAVGTLLYFSALDATHGRELWKSNGSPTAPGTDLLKDIEINPTIANSSNPNSITSVGGGTFLVATTINEGTELWVDNTAVLPISSLELKGRLVQNNGLLEWKTYNESNTASFIIERSINGRTYTQVGIVAASGNTNGLVNYQFTDQNITTLGVTVVYYRIQQKDLDGHFSFSKIISLPVNSKISFAHLYPNPVQNEANLMISVNQDENMQLQIIDNTGRILRYGSHQLSTGSTSVGINVNGLVTGIYYLRIRSNSIQKQISFFKE